MSRTDGSRRLLVSRHKLAVKLVAAQSGKAFASRTLTFKAKAKKAKKAKKA